MKFVTSFSTPIEAHLALARLESAGIDAVIRDEHMVTFHWLASNAVGGVKIEVAEEDYEDAVRILGMPRLEDGIFVCPHCGSHDAKARVLSVWGAVCIFFKLPLPLRNVTVDCQKCGKDFSAPMGGDNMQGGNE